MSSEVQTPAQLQYRVGSHYKLSQLKRGEKGREEKGRGGERVDKGKDDVGFGKMKNFQFQVVNITVF